MGFTRYWKVKKALPATRFRKAASDVRNMLKGEGAWGESVQFDYDVPNKPLCNVNAIRFNGIGDDGHETFYFLPNETSFDFCKTARKPYDVYVCAALCILAKHFPDDVVVESDDEGDYDAAAHAMVEKYCTV